MDKGRVGVAYFRIRCVNGLGIPATGSQKRHPQGPSSLVTIRAVANTQPLPTNQQGQGAHYLAGQPAPGLTGKFVLI